MYILLDVLVCSIAVYYIDMSVLLENTSLVKFIRNNIRDSLGWRIFHILTSEDDFTDIKFVSLIVLKFVGT